MAERFGCRYFVPDVMQVKATTWYRSQKTRRLPLSFWDFLAAGRNLLVLVLMLLLLLLMMMMMITVMMLIRVGGRNNDSFNGSDTVTRRLSNKHLLTPPQPHKDAFGRSEVPGDRACVFANDFHDAMLLAIGVSLQVEASVPGCKTP